MCECRCQGGLFCFGFWEAYEVKPYMNKQWSKPVPLDSDKLYLYTPFLEQLRSASFEVPGTERPQPAQVELREKKSTNT